ncbi:MAG TPA: hypothetical protein VNV16_12910 [Methylibium sp.]|nr:hypothetical protein [Methylibium sp.]
MTLLLLTSKSRAGIPPRRAGHFHLLAQMKVTKAKGLIRFGSIICHEGSVDHDRGSSQAESSKQMNWPNAVRALSFGSFSLGQQRKGTRLPGRNPGAASRVPTGVAQ